jgi:hypothetical protein
MKLTLIIGGITFFIGGCSHIKTTVADRRISCINDFIERSVGAEKAHKICSDIIKEL